MNTQNKAPNPIYKTFNKAGLKEVFFISAPLMLASLSGLLMYFVDRLILARYSLSALNAATVGGMAANVFCYGMLSITTIAQVFVARKNGAKEYSETARPVWQMIWFSLLSFLMAIPVALFMGPLLDFSNEFNGQAKDYFVVLMLFGPINICVGALSSFFLGIERVKIIPIVTFIGNLLNILLDVVLVFGLINIFPALGAMGAAIATGLSHTSQLLIYFSLFLSKKYRQKYNTTACSLDLKLLYISIKIGIPRAAGHIVDLMAWTMILSLMTMAGTLYISMMSIGQSLIFLFSFFSIGLNQGVTNIFANYVGVKMNIAMWKLLRSSGILVMVYSILLFIPLVIMPTPLIQLFLKSDHENYETILSITKKASLFIWIYILIGGIAQSLSGILTAKKDTVYLFISHAVAAWVFIVPLTYLYINILKSPPSMAWGIMALYVGLLATFFGARVYYSSRS